MVWCGGGGDVRGCRWMRWPKAGRWRRHGLVVEAWAGGGGAPNWKMAGSEEKQLMKSEAAVVAFA